MTIKEGLPGYRRGLRLALVLALTGASFLFTSSPALAAWWNPITWFSNGSRSNQMAEPSIDPNSGSYNVDFNITISSSELASEIRYTIDGTEPTRQSYPNYLTSSITLPIRVASHPANTVLTYKAKAFDTNYQKTESATVTRTYTLNTTNPPDTDDPAVTVKANNSTSDITVNQNSTVRISWKIDNYNSSDNCRRSGNWGGQVTTSEGGEDKTLDEIKQYYYTVTCGSGSSAVADRINVNVQAVQKQLNPPTLTPAGSFTTSKQITITAPTTVTDNSPVSGVTVHYTNDNTEPDSSSPSSPLTFTITGSTVVKAKAFKTGYTQSTLATAIYTKTELPPNNPPIVRIDKVDNINVTSTGNEFTKGSDIDFKITVVATDSDGISKYMLYSAADINGQYALFGENNTGIFILRYTNSGKYYFKAKATDNMGNISNFSGEIIVNIVIISAEKTKVYFDFISSTDSSYKIEDAYVEVKDDFGEKADSQVVNIDGRAEVYLNVGERYTAYGFPIGDKFSPSQPVEFTVNSLGNIIRIPLTPKTESPGKAIFDIQFPSGVDPVLARAKFDISNSSGKVETINSYYDGKAKTSDLASGQYNISLISAGFRIKNNISSFTINAGKLNNYIIELEPATILVIKPIIYDLMNGNSKESKISILSNDKLIINKEIKEEFIMPSDIIPGSTITIKGFTLIDKDRFSQDYVIAQPGLNTVIINISGNSKCTNKIRSISISYPLCYTGTNSKNIVEASQDSYYNVLISINNMINRLNQKYKKNIPEAVVISEKRDLDAKAEQGYIYLTRGFIDAYINESQTDNHSYLAEVIAHEYGHLSPFDNYHYWEDEFFGEIQKIVQKEIVTDCIYMVPNPNIKCTYNKQNDEFTRPINSKGFPNLAGHPWELEWELFASSFNIFNNYKDEFKQKIDQVTDFTQNYWLNKMYQELESL